jgi:hypothetical protein
MGRPAASGNSPRILRDSPIVPISERVRRLKIGSVESFNDCLWD